MKDMKRILSLVLCFAMLVGLMPMFALNADAAESDIHYLMFATDRHKNTSVIGNIINNMESVIGENQLEYLGLGGDMVGSGNDHPEYDSSVVLAEATNATSSLNADNVDIVAGIHDMNVNDDAGIVLRYQGGGAQIYEGDDYYVYGVEEYCISDDSDEQNWVAQADAFEAWANSANVDPSKVIIVLSHYPLHANRDDNDGAMYWHWALNAVATGNAYGNDTTVERDILFFHGHNHTVDKNEYVYNVGDTMSIQNGSKTESAAIYYTYATAGYLNQNSKATLVTITDDQIVLTKYGTSGSGTAMATVKRYVTEETPVETTVPATEETTPVVDHIEVVSNKDVYYVGDALDITVYEVYSNGDKVEVKDYTTSGFDSTTTGLKSVFVTYGEHTTTVSVTVEEQNAEPALTGIQVTYSKEILMGQTLTLKVVAEYNNGETVELTADQYTIEGYDAAATGAQGVVVTYETQSYGFTVVTADDVTVVAEGMNSVTVTNVTETLTEALAEELAEGFVAYDIKPNAYVVDKNIAVVSMPAPEGANAVYYWNEETQALEPVSDFTIVDGKVYFTTNHFSTYVVGRSTEITIPDSETATGSGTTPATKKWVYLLTNQPSAGNSYLIVNGNAAGSYYALANNSGNVAATGVTIKTDSEIGTYIELTDATDELWTVGGSYTFQNGTYYLGYTEETTEDWWGNTSTSYKLGLTETARTWAYSSNRLSTSAGNNTYYLRYNDGWTWTNWGTNYATRVYFYTLTEVTVEGESTISGTYSIEGDDQTVVVSEEVMDTIMSATLTFTPDDGGEATTEFVDNAAYTVYSDPDLIVESIEGNTLNFTGKYGTAVIKVTSEVTFGTETKTVTDYFTVTASAPYYTIELCDPVTVDGTTTYEPITAPIALKGIEAGDTYSIWAVVKEYDGLDDEDGEDGEDLGDVEDDRLYWTVSDPSIATIDSATGVITFTGTNYGTFDVTVHYLDENGKSLCEDTVTISATKSQYVVPGDGTDDFPEYPNEGAVRFDKTATALGNFSETGIAKVELSMTGVPYTTGSELDVTVMLDMSTSMDDTRIAATVAATKAFIDSIVKNEDGTYNANRIYVGYFNGDTVYTITDTANIGGELASVDSDAEYEALIDDIESEYDGSKTSSGTNYDVSLEKCYNVLNDIKTTESATEAGYNRQQFCVFMSDGGPTDYATSASTVISESSIVNYFSVGTAGSTTVDPDEYTNTVPAEYWSGLMKANDVTIYSVGLILQEQPSSGPQTYRKYTDDQYYYITKTLLTGISSGEDYFFNCESSSDTAEMEGIFSNIAQKILEAATDVVVEDKIGNDYTVNFSFPTGVTTAEADGLSQFYIQVVEYQLNADKERTGDPTVLENFTFDANGALVSHTVNGTVTCEGTACTHVTFTTNKVSAIKGTYFEYTCAPLLDDEGNEVKNEVGDTITEEYLTWKADKLTTTELALQYFAHLDNSTGTDVDNQVPAGTYYTNEYATLTYTNVNGNRVQQEFPVPQMTWNGAQVTYVFYLVNDAGQPVNRAGRVVPFAESVYVTDPVTFNVTWNEQTGTENILAHDIFAEAGVPDVYGLYDNDAQYVIRVYQTENVDENGVNGNYFQINGAANKQIDSALDSDTTLDNSTTVVFNTKTGVKYDEYGIYSIYDVNTKLTNGTNEISTTVKATDIDYANTTVAFAVVWKPELVPDTVVVDYGLDVVIDVITNDTMAAGVKGVRNDAPHATADGTYTRDEANTLTSVDVYINEDSLKVGTASVENLNQVRFSLDKTNGMQFSEPAEFYYEADVNFYDSNNELQTTSMYSSVTVIPATTIYYEDSFLDLTSFSKQTDGTWTEDETPAWTTDGNVVGATQAQDRPGESKISAALDADNNYGYDAAYESMSTHSLGSSAKITVDANTRGEAYFTFWGTGFDVISTTSNTTGTIIVQVFAGDKAEGTAVNTYIVDTYYGYTKNADGEWVVTENEPNALYQVPVMKIFGLDYAQYTVKITAGWNDFFDHVDGSASYDLYLDAIRIYDPTGNQNQTANDAYIADGEAYPEYFEVRDQIISKATFDNLNDDAVSGIVFIDGGIAVPSIEDYTSYGPNNETYLKKDQAIAFDLNGTYTVPAGMKLAKIQLAVKTVGGTGKVEVYGVKEGKVTTCLNETISTATDMYYDITALEGMTVVIKSTGDAIISITNVKVTYAPDVNATVATASVEETEVPMLFSIRRSTANAALATLSVEEEEIPETTVPEETVPETTVPEETVPETTVPEETEPQTEPAKPDNSELKAAVDAAKKLKEKDYTKESFQAVKAARKAAEKVLKDKNATQAEIDEALAELNEAVEALETKAPAANKPGKTDKENQSKPNSNKNNGTIEQQAEQIIVQIANLLFGWLFN